MKVFGPEGNEIVELIVGDESYRYRKIMGENAITLKVEKFEYVEIPVGSYVDFQGERYSLLKPQNVKKSSSREFEYTIIFEAPVSLLGLYKLRDTTSRRLKFSLTAKPHEFLQVVVDNLNQRDSGWTLGDCIEMTEKSLSFNHVYCDEALKMIADAFETEFEVNEKAVSLRKVEHNKDASLELSYGKGNGFKSGVRRENTDNSKAVEILYVQGGERNIDASKYGSRELLLPKNQTIIYEGRQYQTDELGFSVFRADKLLSSFVEDSLDCSHIYPSRVGEVTAVVEVNADKHFYDFEDNTIPAHLNFKSQLIAGEKMSVIFETGMLAGKEFDVDYIHTGKKFQIVPQEIDGVTMPNSIFKPVVGDKYSVFGISLPDTYVCNNDDKTGASWDMFREAVKYLYENEDPRFSFTGELDSIWARKNWLAIGSKIRLGGYVAFTDQQFQTEPVLIRIVGIKDYINQPYSPEIELSNITIGAGFASHLKKLETTEVVVEEKHRNSISFAKRGFRETKETTRMLQEALQNFSGSINPVSVNTMQLLLGDESLQFRFVNSMVNPTEIAHAISYDSGTKIISVEAGIIQHMTLGIEEISTSHSNYRFWSLNAYNSPYMGETDKSYYLYAKVSKTNQSGSFLLSEVPVSMESDTNFYHLLVAVVNSEFENNRSVVLLYGFTEILPGRITTKKIVSEDGKTYFDLQNNTIGGSIKFISTGGDYTDVGDKIEEVENNVTYKVEIISTNGNAFRNDVIETTLIAVVYKGRVDITASLPLTSFRWVRTSDNAAGDAVWNQIHETFYSNILVITGDDVDGRAVFNCQVTII